MFVTAMVGAGPTRTYLGQTSSASNGTAVYTFSSFAIGAADPSRYIVVGAVGQQTLTATTISSITIGGNSALINQAKGTLAPNVTNIMSGIAGFSIPTGTTTTIVITFSGVIAGGAAIAVYSLLDLASTTPFDSNGAGNTSTSISVSTTLNVPGGGIAIVSSAVNNSDTLTLTGLTTDYNYVFNTFNGHVGGSNQDMAAQSGLTLTQTGVNAARIRSIIAASWA